MCQMLRNLGRMVTENYPLIFIATFIECLLNQGHLLSLRRTLPLRAVQEEGKER